MNLNRQFDEFKKKVANQVVYAKPQVNQTRIQSKEEQDALRNELQSLGQSDKKRKIDQVLPDANPQMTSNVFAILNYLKKVDKPQNLDDIKYGAQVDVRADQGLFERLKLNPRIRYLHDVNMFEFLPEHDIRTTENLLRTVKQRYHSNIKGDEPAPICFEIKDLLDSNPNVKPLIEELEEQGSIYVTRKPNDNSIKAVYYNPQIIPFKVDDEFKNIWSTLRIPDETDLNRDLQSAGIKTNQVTKIRVAQKQPTKKKSSSNRKIKLTNQHLEGIDLTQDYLQSKN